MANRILVRINSDFLEDYDRLGKNQKNKNFENSPFQIRKDVFMLAATCGFLKDQEEELPNNAHDLFSTTTLTKHDLAALKAMYINKNNMDIENALESDEKIIRQAERWAEAGLKHIKMRLFETTNPLPPIYILSDWITDDEMWFSKK
jgi:hypothetical protein